VALRRRSFSCHRFLYSYLNTSLNSRLFAKQGYRIALIARNADNLKKLAGEINAGGGEAAAFPVADYTYKNVLSVFDTITTHAWGPNGERAEVRAALWNVGEAPFKLFLDVTEEELERSLQTHVTAAFAFSRQVVLAFQKNDVDEHGCRGTLLFTGATASLRGNTHTSAFAAGKFGIRALSQALAKEFGKQNIHVGCPTTPVSNLYLSSDGIVCIGCPREFRI
jgi:NAD(P)-dependent dehydrogenase (short-subunit alcohol dehydrogenase family)